MKTRIYAAPAVKGLISLLCLGKKEPQKNIIPDQKTICILQVKRLIGFS